MSENEMYAPRQGDVVEVVVRGRVSGFSANGFVVDENSSSAEWMGGTYVVPTGGQVVSVVKVPDPIPTEPGTVIWCHEAAWQLYFDGFWRSTAGGTMGHKTLQSYADKHGFSVLRTP